MKKSSIALLLAASLATLPACNGLFEGLYDQPAPTEENGFGFIRVDSSTRSGTIYIDATSYTVWNYIDFRTSTVVALGTDADEPAAWDFAVHRYDAKTNGGSVLDTALSDFEPLRNAEQLPDGDYVEDIWTTEQITVDMSHMMDGYLIYVPSFYNPVLSQWLDVDTSTMPPIYTPSKRIYVIRLSDGLHAAVRLSGYTDTAGIKGYMTIDYLYPLEH
ncbi:MAG: HmuY family protein [Alistipes sp.]|nr:HmuY family protein [Alistipes sp.]MDE6507013.1 HmuY family protein [Alistipes sp.]